MKATVLGVFADMRRRRLLPIALLLLVAIVAVPLVLRQPAESAAPGAPQPAAAQAPNGLPSPQQALNGNDKPLVTLAVLEQASNLDEFESKNPFKPLEQTSTGGSSAQVPADAPTSAPGSDAPGSAGGSSDGGSGSGSSGGAGNGGSGTTPTPSTPPSSDGDGGDGDDKGTEKKTLTYALDMTLEGPKRTVRYRSLPKLNAVPSADNPLLIYLGVDGTGQNAVFLVDSSLTVESGEGTCSPATDSCGTLKLEPGQVQVFRTDKDARYEIRIDQIREVSAASAARAARRANRAAASKAEATSASPQRRFVPPVIADLFTRSTR